MFSLLHHVEKNPNIQLWITVTIILALIIVHEFTFSEILFLHTVLSYCLVSFHFHLQDSWAFLTDQV